MHTKKIYLNIVLNPLSLFFKSFRNNISNKEQNFHQTSFKPH